MLYMLAREMARGGAEGVGGEVGGAMRPNEDSGRRAMPADCLPILRSASHRSRQICSCPAIPVSHVSTPGCRTALVGGEVTRVLTFSTIYPTPPLSLRILPAVFTRVLCSALFLLRAVL